MQRAAYVNGQEQVCRKAENWQRPTTKTNCPAKHPHSKNRPNPDNGSDNGNYLLCFNMHRKNGYILLTSVPVFPSHDRLNVIRRGEEGSRRKRVALLPRRQKWISPLHPALWISCESVWKWRGLKHLDRVTVRHFRSRLRNNTRNAGQAFHHCNAKQFENSQFKREALCLSCVCFHSCIPLLNCQLGEVSHISPSTFSSV